MFKSLLPLALVLLLPLSARSADIPALLELLRGDVMLQWLNYSSEGIRFTRMLGVSSLSSERDWATAADTLAKPENETFANELRERLLRAEADRQQLFAEGLGRNEYVFGLLQHELPVIRNVESGALEFADVSAESYQSARDRFLEGQGLKPTTAEIVLARAGGKPMAVPADFVRYLPETTINKPVLMFQTRSPQFAEPGHPRVIHFSTDGNTFFGIGTEPGSPGSRVVEVLDRDPVTGQFKAKVLRFRPEGGVEIEHDPKSCAGCHGPSLNPIWDMGLSNDVWPGAYGALTTDRLDLGKAKTFVDAFGKGPSAAEPIFAPYIGDKLSAASLWQHNVELTRKIDFTVAARLAEAIRGLPLYEQYRADIQAAVSADPEAGLSADDLAQMREMQARIETAYQAYEQDLLARAARTHAGENFRPGGLPARPPFANLARLRLTLSRMGAEGLFDDWAFRFTPRNATALGHGPAIRPAAVSVDSYRRFAELMGTPGHSP